MPGGDANPIVAEACDRFGLGEPAAPPVLHHGGVNRLWRVATGAGVFAVHELCGTGPQRDAVGRWQRIFDLEVAPPRRASGSPGPWPSPQPARRRS